MEKYTAPKGNLENKVTIFEAIKKYKHDKKIFIYQIKLAELQGNYNKKQFYEEKLEKLQNTRGKTIRRFCTKIATLIAVPIIILGSSIVVADHAHNNNVNKIVENLEGEQNISLIDDNGTIDYNETILAMIRQKVADYYHISPSEIEISADYINNISHNGSTALQGGETLDISINKKGKDDNLYPICSYNSYKEAEAFTSKQKTDTFPKGQASRKILTLLKKIAKGNKINSFDVTDLDNENLDNLPPSLPKEESSLDYMER